jgi:heptosyltransferase-1
MRQLERVLIIKVSSIGDVVHALPVSAALGEAFPHLKLTWLVGEQAASMVQGNPYLHEVIVLPGDWQKRPFALGTPGRFLALRRELRARRFDLAIDLQGLLGTALFALACGARYRFGCDWLREGSHLLLTRIPRRPESIHIVDQMLDVARFLGAPATSVKFPLHISPEEDARALELLESVGIADRQEFLAVNPTEGGGPGHKGLGVERLTALFNELGRDGGPPIVLVGGNGDRALGEALLQLARPRPRDLIGTTVKEMAAILRRAALHFAGDTGSAHIAAALGTPVVSIFGRSNPVRLAPYGQADWVVQRRGECAPVCRRYHETAPLNSEPRCFAPPPACMAALTVAEIAAAVRRCLNQAGRTAGPQYAQTSQT